MRKILLITLAAIVAFPAFAQTGKKEVTLTITRTINGVTSSNDTSFYVNDPSEVEGILERMGIDEPKENQTLEKRIVIRDVEEEGQSYTFETPGPKPMIGVYLQDHHYPYRDMKRGVYVTSITDGSGAEAAGLRKGDMIISIEGVDVNDSDDIGDVKSAYKVGDKIDIQVYRDGSIQNYAVELGGKKTRVVTGWKDNLRNNGGAMITKEENKPFLGVIPHTVDDDIIRKYRLGGAATEGVFLSEIVKNSGAERAGLKAGDVIVEINGEEIEDNGDLSEAIREAASENEGEMLITYIRDGRRRTDRAQLGQKTYTKKVWKGPEEITKEKVEEQRAYLGVYLETNGRGGVTVTRPITGGAAEKAGIESQDVIQSIGGEETPDYNSLVKVLRNKRPGERVRIEFLRDGDRRSTTVTLGQKTVTKWVVKEKVKNQSIDVNVIINEFENKDEAQALVEDMENPSLEMPDFDVFPNPSNGRFTLRFTPQRGAPVRIKIFDLKGSVLYQEQLTDFEGTYNKQINISDNPAGNYFLQVTQGGEGMAKQLIVN